MIEIGIPNVLEKERESKNIKQKKTFHYYEYTKT